MKAGQTLTAHAGAWTPGAWLAFQRYANDSPLGGGNTLTLTRAMVDTRMTESVTGGADDYTSLTRTSKTTVPVVSDVTPTPPQRYPYPATAGAFCAQQYPGWRGVTVTGVAVRCMSSPTDSRVRWLAV